MLQTAFTLWGVATSWLEVLAFGLALACIVCNVFEVHWGWPLAIASSLLYFYLFYINKLYGDAWLQVFFAVIAVWGWWQWLYGHRNQPANPSPHDSLKVICMQIKYRWLTMLAWVLGWLLLGLMLARTTDTDVPWFDAFPTAGSVIGQVLLARKYVENWLVWMVVNLVGTVLFAYKNLWLTAVLYFIFAALSVMGHLRWKRILPDPVSNEAA
jgi:nicotinamide mononucleotide transporter